MPAKIPDIVYTETDATYIRKQQRGRKRGLKKRHFEVKLGLNYTGKEGRYKSGKGETQRLKKKSIYAGIRPGRKRFLEDLSYISERDYGLSAAKKSYFGGDGDAWIRSGHQAFYPRSEYLLCLYHLFKRLREAFAGKKEQQAKIKSLFEASRIQEALTEIGKAAEEAQEEKEHELIQEYYGYVKNNRDGIEASIRMRTDKGGRSAVAVEANIDKTIAHRFKKRGMSWSEDGATALLKIRQVIFNGEWDDWWYENVTRGLR